MNEADGHARDDLDDAQGHGADQDLKGVIQRGEQGRPEPHKGALRVQQLQQLGDEIPKEAAGQRPHEEGAHAAQAKQGKKVVHPLLGARLGQHHHRGQHHQKPVSHVCHHHTVKQDEEWGHQGVGVHRSVGRQGIHLRNHVQRAGEPVVFQAHRHLGVLLLRWVLHLPGAGVGGQLPLRILPPLRGDPPPEQEGLLRIPEPGPALLPVDEHRGPVRGPADVICQAGHAGQFLLCLPETLRVLGQLPVQTGVIFPGRARPAIQWDPGPPEVPQGLQHRLLGALVADQQAIAHLPAGAGLDQLGQLAGLFHRPLGLLQGTCGGQSTELHQHLTGGAALQREVQGQPGGQRRLLGGQLPLLRLEQGGLPVLLEHRLHRPRPCGAGGRLKQLLLGQLGPRGEHPSAFGPAAGQHGQRPLRRLLLLLHLGQGGAVRRPKFQNSRQPLPVSWGCVGTAVRLCRLADLHAAHPL